MSKSITVWVYLKRPKIDSECKVPTVCTFAVTIDDDYDDFSRFPQKYFRRNGAS